MGGRKFKKKKLYRNSTRKMTQITTTGSRKSGGANKTVHKEREEKDVKTEGEKAVKTVLLTKSWGV